MTLNRLEGHFYCKPFNVIFRKAVQQLPLVQLTWCVARSLCNSRASCYTYGEWSKHFC